MEMRINTHELPLRNAFTISRGSFDHQQTVVVELEENGKVGFGEATQHAYYGHTTDSISTSLQTLSPLLEQFDIGSPETIWQSASEVLNEDDFALSAFDQAVHDLHGKLHGTSVFTRAGLTWDNVPMTSITLSINSISNMIEQMHQYADWPIFKIKLGADQDLEIMQALRQETDAVLRVDANCAWTAEQTVEMSHALHELDIEFIEQPLPATASAADKEYVYKNSVLPVIADESCMHEDDVIRCVDRFHGINVKLSKCGGLTPAFRMLKKARELGLKTMAGCMIESDVAIGAALQLSPLLDFADLDGSVLLAEQPFTGVSIINGTMAKPIGVGTGVSAIAASTEVSNY